MRLVQGKYNTAKVFTKNIDEKALEQIIEFCDQEFAQGSKIRIMPDCHAGAGCVIGFTADLGDKVIPNLVGVDIGCGMYVAELGKVDMDLPKLDRIINRYIPAGMDIHDRRMVNFNELDNLYCYRDLKNMPRIENSLGTLGGGNHFIECNIDPEGNTYLVLHSGSRNLGKQVADLYQKLAIDRQKNKSNGSKVANPALCYLTGKQKDQYLHDMAICQGYAALNRETMAEMILDRMSLASKNHFHTIHNYIDFKDNIIRKGSVAAYEGEKIIIPINMRDGSIIARGKGNPDWNYSAPHGAGRLMSRTQAKQRVSLAEFEKSMQGIYTTSVNSNTLDESPMAYKPLKEIVDNIQDAAEITAIIKPIYNFKSAENSSFQKRRGKKR